KKAADKKAERAAHKAELKALTNLAGVAVPVKAKKAASGAAAVKTAAAKTAGKASAKTKAPGAGKAAKADGGDKQGASPAKPKAKKVVAEKGEADDQQTPKAARKKAPPATR